MAVPSFEKGSREFETNSSEDKRDQIGPIFVSWAIVFVGQFFL
jgi:hypothetical protein